MRSDVLLNRRATLRLQRNEDNRRAGSTATGQPSVLAGKVEERTGALRFVKAPRQEVPPFVLWYPGSDGYFT